MLKFALLDPRPIPAAIEANNAVFDGGQVLGIEVTVPALAARCSLGNIDPQHLAGNAHLTAIEAVMSITVPQDGAVLATIRADLDSVGAMAVLRMRAAARDSAILAAGTGELLAGVDPNGWQPTGPLLERISLVAEADRFARGGYPGPRPLPTSDNRWPESGASAESSRPLAAIAAAVTDFRVPVADRVATMEKWLLTGNEPESYRTQVERERMDMIRALEDGSIEHHTEATGIAIVKSAHRAATLVGYASAPVVVALNPEFRFGGGEPHAKFTVCQFTTEYLDLRAALAELAELEPGWGGSPTIGGSPQGVSSTLSVEQVVDVIARHLRK
ncbi:hypothetical protein KBC70_02925 [Candidatus Woesebacteria bacterium]|nr:hypothetical protein [Candidatus Woesebacteria bacterium]